MQNKNNKQTGPWEGTQPKSVTKLEADGVNPAVFRTIRQAGTSLSLSLSLTDHGARSREDVHR